MNCSAPIFIVIISKPETEKILGISWWCLLNIYRKKRSKNLQLKRKKTLRERKNRAEIQGENWNEVKTSENRVEAIKWALSSVLSDISYSSTNKQWKRFLISNEKTFLSEIHPAVLSRFLSFSTIFQLRKWQNLSPTFLISILIW